MTRLKTTSISRSPPYLGVQRLIKLERSLASDSVLSVYAGPTPADPAARSSIELRDEIRDLRGWLSHSPARERKRFEACSYA